MDPKATLERLDDALPDQLSGHPRIAACLLAFGVLALYAINPAAAQEGCSSALDAVFTTGLGMVFGYGQPLIVIVAFAGILAAITNPLFPWQNALGFAVLVILIIGLGAFMVVTAFTDAAFTQMGAPEPCVSIGGGGDDGGSGSVALLPLIITSIKYRFAEYTGE